jgi:putative PIG3 family NAD(P)H quinone oxidoreductase
MRAVLVENPGPESTLRIGEVPAPALGEGALRIQVAAAGVNRADLMQRQGRYPPPPGASDILGLECAGEVLEVGSGVKGFEVGQRVMALLAGGGYADEVVVPAACVMPVPSALSLAEAAALPEVFLTVFLNLFQLGGFEPGGTALVHGGGSGIGTAATQLVKAASGRIVVTAGSDEKCARCLELGADRAVNYRNGDFVEAARELGGGAGVDVVLDHIGGSYLERNLQSLAVGGRLIVIGLMGGAKAELPLALLLVKRLSVIGSTLRTRPLDEKGRIVAGFLARFGARVEKRELVPVVDRVVPLEQVEAAHAAMQESQHFGKIVLQLR